MSYETYLEQIKTWYEKEPERIFIISGYAGCGKTTLARTIPELLKLNYYVFLTPTGIAASILSKEAKTIHSYLYITTEDPVTKELVFRKRHQYEFEEDLIIVDEISMVNEELLADLKMLDIPIVGLGDPQQLPPVNGQSTILEKPDVFLTKVWRNDGGILDLATDIRNHIPLKIKYENVEFRRSIFFDLKMLNESSIVICRYNKTRRKLNVDIREKVYGRSQILQIKDKIMILQNDKDTGLMNGSIVEVYDIKFIDGDILKLTIKTFEGQLINILAGFWVIKGLERPKGFTHIKDERGRKIRIFDIDYAYAITCHKSQGSEFESVFVMREGRNFDDWDKWFYTAVTRARKKLYIY